MKVREGLKDTIDIWDEKLIEYGTEIILKRREFINKLNSLSRLMHRKITDGKENLEVKYIPNIKFDIIQGDYKNIKENFMKKLKNSIDLDFSRGYTCYGPHKDDLGLYINEVDIRNFGSQGQQRTAALSLKLSEIELIKSEIGEYPVLLLDDVMSELDSTRQIFLVKNLQRVQTFITTTEIPEKLLLYVKNSKIFHVNKGEVT